VTDFKSESDRIQHFFQVKYLLLCRLPYLLRYYYYYYYYYYFRLFES